MFVRSAFIYSQKFTEFKAYKGHPWLFDRSEVTYKLCKKLKLFDHDSTRIHTPKPARTEALLSFHTKKYISLLRKANKGLSDEKWLQYGLGTTECPVFKGVYDYSALAAGATLMGAELIDQGKADVVFSPTGGFHHAGEDFAAGFCYVNDVVVAIKKWLRRRKRVLYIDIDAHHGDQVQAAFYNTSKAMTVSFHESGHTLFPFKTGFENEIGRGRGKGYSINIPLPENTCDEEFLWAFNRIFLPVARAFQPDVVVAVLGADVLFSDPFSSLQLTNISVTQALQTISEVSPKLLALGGGGYIRDNIARTWTLAWAIMNHLGPSEEDSAAFGGVFWGDGLSSLKDRPLFLPDNIKKKTKKEIQRVVRAVERDVFPLLKIKPERNR
jgi:acetoin utilization protein AcuC